jgi:hypothetical protein|eukprot:COSAG03_NODE_390_length_8302_cov_70.582317_3_plen_174_part_00
MAALPRLTTRALAPLAVFSSYNTRSSHRRAQSRSSRVLSTDPTSSFCTALGTMTGTMKVCLGHPTHCATSGAKRLSCRCTVGATLRTGVKTHRVDCDSSQLTTPPTRSPTRSLSSSSSIRKAPRRDASHQWSSWSTFHCSCRSSKTACTAEAPVTVVVNVCGVPPQSSIFVAS